MTEVIHFSTVFSFCPHQVYKEIQTKHFKLQTTMLHTFVAMVTILQLNKDYNDNN